MRSVLHAAAQLVQHAAPADLALKAGEELLSRRAGNGEVEGFGDPGCVASRKTASWARSTAYSRS